MNIEYRVDLDDIEGCQTSGVGDNFHEKLRFPVTQPPRNKRPYAGRRLGIEDVDIQTDMQPPPMSEPVQCFGSDFSHAALINVPHRINSHPALIQDLTFTGVERADTDQDNILWLQGGSRTSHVDKLGKTMAKQKRQGHPMNVA